MYNRYTQTLTQKETLGVEHQNHYKVRVMYMQQIRTVT